MNKVIIGVNESDEALDALRLGNELATDEGAEVLVVSVFVFDPLATAQAYDEARASFVKKVAGRSDAALARTGYQHVAPNDTPARALQRLAEDEDADLIVVGSTHRGALGRVLPGSVGERLLHGAPCAVAVAPRGYARGAHRGLGLIGVGYDGFPESELALAEAARIARRRNCELRVITVGPTFSGMGERLGPYEPLRDHFRTQLDHAVSEASNGIEADGVLDEGDPAAALAQRGVELDLLVLGSRGYGPLRHALLGGVSSEVIRTAPCPVVVVPRGAKESTERRADPVGYAANA